MSTCSMLPSETHDAVVSENSIVRECLGILTSITCAMKHHRSVKTSPVFLQERGGLQRTGGLRQAAPEAPHTRRILKPSCTDLRSRPRDLPSWWENSPVALTHGQIYPRVASRRLQRERSGAIELTRRDSRPGRNVSGHCPVLHLRTTHNRPFPAPTLPGLTIAAHLTASGVPPRGSRWHCTTISNILRRAA